VEKIENIFARKPDEVNQPDEAKEFIFTKKKLVTLVALILVVNLILSGAVLGIGIGTYAQWGKWFEKNILGKEAAVIDQSINNDGTEITMGKELGGVLKEGNKEIQIIDEQSQVEAVVERVSPAVVSIIVTKDIPKMEQYYEDYDPFGGDSFFEQFFGNDYNFQVPQYRQNGTEKREIGGGTGFIVGSDGLIVTNKHVVEDQAAEYTVLMNDGQKYEAQVLARDSVNDIAILKINKDNLTTIQLGDSDKLKAGQTVIAIGNALGEYRNTVSKGVISGLKREIVAGGVMGQAEQLSGVIKPIQLLIPAIPAGHY